MRFDDKVVLITGSSRGLGNAFARCVAGSGALTVVNSTGRDDGGEKAVAEIEAQGGKAIHIAGDVREGAALIGQVVDTCGRIDAVVHNAGIIMDKTVRKMSLEQWRTVLDVHLTSAFLLSQAAWPHFEAQGGGRLVFISSSAALYGNFGQGNYAAAKLGLYGLCRTIALEGARGNICCNVVCPFGATEMNSAHMSEERKATIKTDYVAPLVGYLAHPDCAETGGLFEASGGSFKMSRWEQSEGLRLDPTKPMSIDDIAAGWDQLVDFANARHPANMGESLLALTDPDAP